MFAAPGISASPSEENLRYFNVIILGPQNTPYEGDESTATYLCNMHSEFVVPCYLRHVIDKEAISRRFFQAGTVFTRRLSNGSP